MAFCLFCDRLSLLPIPRSGSGTVSIQTLLCVEVFKGLNDAIFLKGIPSSLDDLSGGQKRKEIQGAVTPSGSSPFATI